MPSTLESSSSPHTSLNSAPLAVLLSGGIDSAVLLAEAIETDPAVCPLYVRSGLKWEPDELAHLERFLEAVKRPHLRPLSILELPVTDLYGDHWSVTGNGVPGAETPDEAVFLPGRNVLLLAKAIIWCCLHDIPSVALATLAGNPFPDATPGFFQAFQAVVNQAIEANVQVVRPFAGMTKREVLLRGQRLPLELTFSCIAPVNGAHCGHCNKCEERRRAFAETGIEDRTEYAFARPSRV
jgi:7-cyano-7-deazaguanine synthase